MINSIAQSFVVLPFSKAMKLAKSERIFPCLVPVFLLTALMCIIEASTIVSNQLWFPGREDSIHILKSLFWHLGNILFPVVLFYLAVSAVLSQRPRANSFWAVLKACFWASVCYFALIYVLVYQLNQVLAPWWLNRLEVDLTKSYALILLVSVVNSAIFVLIYTLSALVFAHSLWFHECVRGRVSLKKQIVCFCHYAAPKFKLVAAICVMALISKHLTYISFLRDWWLVFSIALDALGSSLFVLMLVVAYIDPTE
ncbi:hypothetical protein QWY20_17525 [Alkalimonas sp. MEB108]|uniref:Uncharacterized protein n=1 Tax=Alkalimonas cellulosilytica TaxID=3058395 RepID=A0ABU7J9N6_9GAMM|nr:hypothetical protein [Alkalimonas sp. MEB108]MEE2003256.1 hypothetical protein [Alkalimonas sp. MEB108]